VRADFRPTRRPWTDPSRRHGPAGSRPATGDAGGNTKEIIMVPIIAWLLGVPLVVILLFMLLF
jgi:hypothetical protein